MHPVIPHKTPQAERLISIGFRVRENVFYHCVKIEPIVLIVDEQTGSVNCLLPVVGDAQGNHWFEILGETPICRVGASVFAVKKAAHDYFALKWSLVDNKSLLMPGELREERVDAKTKIEEQKKKGRRNIAIETRSNLVFKFRHLYAA